MKKVVSSINEQLENIRAKENILFGLLEKHDFSSIGNKIYKAIRKNNPNFIYRAPFFQSIGARIYNIFK